MNSRVSWWGCARISPGCRNCYAADNARRWGHDVFHLGGERRMLSDAYWRKPLKWNREAQQTGIPRRVFCASMADVFEDHPQVTTARVRLWQFIEQTPWLRWQVLTKRPENIATMAPWGDTWPDHVWIGTSVEDQQRADERIPLLLQVNASVRFLSCEPLLGPVWISDYMWQACACCEGEGHDEACARCGDSHCESGHIRKLDWVIVGGESGRGARPMAPQWATNLRDQCKQNRVPYFFKQWGEWAPSGQIAIGGKRPGRALVGEPVDGLGHRTEMVRLGKGKAGRLLDGQSHDAVPPLVPTRATTCGA
ncbi:phage Gp37/Gp68 family protein [Streptomyces umbrinus]|uniref:phage Gp37/Gp68 family protein n=1 Tax=Streptomyces umbrinus TaxID=67370 RepID=UPI0033D0496F